MLVISSTWPTPLPYPPLTLAFFSSVLQRERIADIQCTNPYTAIATIPSEYRAVVI